MVSRFVTPAHLRCITVLLLIPLSIILAGCGGAGSDANPFQPNTGSAWTGQNVYRDGNDVLRTVTINFKTALDSQNNIIWTGTLDLGNGHVVNLLGNPETGKLSGIDSTNGNTYQVSTTLPSTSGGTGSAAVTGDFGQTLSSGVDIPITSNAKGVPIRPHTP